MPIKKFFFVIILSYLKNVFSRIKLKFVRILIIITHQNHDHLSFRIIPKIKELNINILHLRNEISSVNILAIFYHILSTRFIDSITMLMAPNWFVLFFV